MSHALEDDDAAFYGTLLARAVDVVPGAQAGSILLHRAGTNEYHFVAAHGFDLTGLQERCLYEEEMFRDVEQSQASINRDVAGMDLSPDQEEWLTRVGRVRDIRSNVAAPVFVDGDPIAFLSLDNFEDRDAFDSTSIEMTTVLGRMIAELLRRRNLEAALHQERASFEHLAHHDGLTGLANRRHLEMALSDAIEQSSRTGSPLAVLFIDIDDFKRINDVHGHDVGDQVIIEVARALRAATRGDDTVGRWGGDEFMLIVPGIDDAADVAAMTSRVLDAFDDEIPVGSAGTVRCRLSIGAAWSRDGKVQTEDLVRTSDQALYESKQAGKNTVRIVHV